MTERIALRYIDFICSDDVMQPIICSLGEKLEFEMKLLLPPPDLSGPRIEDAFSTFSSDKADFGRICSPAYCLASQYVIPLVAPARNKSEYPVYFSKLFVHQNSSFFNFEDLKGSNFAYNDEMSLSGFHCLKFYLMQYNSGLLESGGSNILPFFRDIIRTGGHTNSVHAVINGRADVLCLDCNILEELQSSSEGSALIAQLRSVPVPSLPSWRIMDPLSKEVVDCTVNDGGRLGPNPSQPVVVSRRLSTELVNKLRQAMLELAPDDLAPIHAACYLPVDDEYYRQIHVMLRHCRDEVIMCEAFDL